VTPIRCNSGCTGGGFPFVAFVACLDDFRFCDIDRSPFDGCGDLGLTDEFDEGDKQLLLRGGVEIGFGFTQLQCCLAVLDFERKLDRIEIGPHAGFPSQSAL
jgi:hypothetical protein